MQRPLSPRGSQVGVLTQVEQDPADPEPFQVVSAAGAEWWYREGELQKVEPSGGSGGATRPLPLLPPPGSIAASGGGESAPLQPPPADDINVNT